MARGGRGPGDHARPLAQERVSDGVIAHEMGHHLTLSLDVPWGKDFAATLGYRRTNGRIHGWPAESVASSSYPTSHARTKASEHGAEVIAARMTDDFHVSPDYRLPAAAAAVVDRKLPRGAEGR